MSQKGGTDTVYSTLWWIDGLHFYGFDFYKRCDCPKYSISGIKCNNNSNNNVDISTFMYKLCMINLRSLIHNELRCCFLLFTFGWHTNKTVIIKFSLLFYTCRVCKLRFLLSLVWKKYIYWLKSSNKITEDWTKVRLFTAVLCCVIWFRFANTIFVTRLGGQLVRLLPFNIGNFFIKQIPNEPHQNYCIKWTKECSKKRAVITQKRLELEFHIRMECYRFRKTRTFEIKFDRITKRMAKPFSDFI